MRCRELRYATRFIATLTLGLSIMPSTESAAADEPMVKPVATAAANWKTRALLTVGETIQSYTVPGVLDGLGAFVLYEHGHHRLVRVLANHELGLTEGYPFSVRGPSGQTVPVAAGARVSYFDVDQNLNVWRAGLAIRRIYDRNQNVVSTMTNFEGTGRATFSRFCSSSLYEPNQFGHGRGLRDRVYITGEEDGGSFSEYAGGQWALDPSNGNLWGLPALGRGGWENVALLDTGRSDFVAFVMGDDTAPFTISVPPSGSAGDIPFNTDANLNSQRDGAPLYLYVGRKSHWGDFLDRNGLKQGWLYVWVGHGAESVADFNGTGQSLGGHFEPVVNKGPWLDSLCPDSRFGAIVEGGTKYGPKQDGFGYASQRCLWFQARTIHKAFQLSRPEDLSVNPKKGSEFVFASTGRENEFGNADEWGTIYTMDVKFKFFHHRPPAITGNLKIIYDANDVATNTAIGYPSQDFGLRSADNLDWADDGLIYIQEDSATSAFGDTSGEEASIWQLDPKRRKLARIAQVDRSVVLDPTTSGTPVDQFAGEIGNWESSGILDVSKLFKRAPGSLFMFDVQAHGITDQGGINPDSRITDGDLKEGGQLLVLSRKPWHH